MASQSPKDSALASGGRRGTCTLEKPHLPAPRCCHNAWEHHQLDQLHGIRPGTCTGPEQETPLVVIDEVGAACVPLPGGCRGPPDSGTCCFPSPCVAPPISAADLNEASEGGLPPPSSCQTPSAKRCSASLVQQSPQLLWFIDCLIFSADQGLM